MIAIKSGVDFTDSFECLGKGVPRSARLVTQLYNLQCKVTQRIFECQALPIANGIKEQIEQEKFRSLLQTLDHFALPRLIQENDQVDNRVYIIMTSNNPQQT